MRAINNFERSIINRILQYHESGITPNIASVIDPLLHDKDIVLDYQNKSVELKADIQFYNQGNITDVVRQITAELVTTVNLLDYLEKNGYVTTYLESSTTGQQRFGQLVQGHNFVNYNFVDPKLIDLLLDYSLKTILVGQSLIDFAKDGYQSKEDLNNRRNIKIALISLIITATLSGIGLIFSYKSLPPTTIDNKSIKALTEPVKQQNKLDSIDKVNQSQLIEFLKKDTIKTRNINKK